MAMQKTSPSVLATDLDGTLIPLEGHAKNRLDLTVLQSELSANAMSLVFVTGRHLESVLEVMATETLPRPDWIICDVGTSIYGTDHNDQLKLVDAYADHLDEIIGSFPIDRLRRELSQWQGLALQEEEKQGRFKLSFYADADARSEQVSLIESMLERELAPYSIISSVDPFNGDGLIDILPQGASKARALDWWAEQHQHDQQSVLFAGDSGNDLAAFSAGFRSIVVGNAETSLVEEVKRAHAARGWTDRMYHAKEFATSGVLEGLRHYLLASNGQTLTGRAE